MSLDELLCTDTETVVHHWIVTGEPGPVPGYFGDGESPRFPSYRFVWSSADPRWPGEKAEAEARGFVNRVQAATPGLGQWESGPFLSHRTVIYSPIEPAP